MAKSAAMQELLLRKGDKIALGVGGGLAGLFLVLGLVAVVGADSPSGTAKQFEDQAKRVRNGVSAQGEDAPPLPDWVGKVQDFKKIPPAEFAFSGRPFEPTTQPDMLAENPKVMWITDAQTDVIRVPMLALDVRDSGRVQPHDRRAGPEAHHQQEQSGTREEPVQGAGVAHQPEVQAVG